jgi:methionyl-tRNA formyltransferase
MSGPVRIVFFGSDAIALPLLQWFADAGSGLGRIVAVFTQPDRPAGRGQRVQANAIKGWALARDLPVFQPEKLAEPERLQLAGCDADVGLVMAYGHLLRDDFLATPRRGMLNLHTSLLPHYRGASPIQTAVASGETTTGVTLMHIVRRLDAGPMVDAERVPVGGRDTALDVEAKLAAACVPLVARALARWETGALPATPQDEAAATYCRKLTKEDGVLDFAAPARVLAARINGLFPWPSCRIVLEGQTVRLGRADVAASVDASSPGVVAGSDPEGLLVGTADGVLRLLSLQREGGRMLPAPEFLRGFPVKAGTTIPSQPMPPLVTRR